MPFRDEGKVLESFQALSRQEETPVEEQLIGDPDYYSSALRQELHKRAK